jgi:hypothetical protein
MQPPAPRTPSSDTTLVGSPLSHEAAGGFSPRVENGQPQEKARTMIPYLWPHQLGTGNR